METNSTTVTPDTTLSEESRAFRIANKCYGLLLGSVCIGAGVLIITATVVPEVAENHRHHDGS